MLSNKSLTNHKQIRRFRILVALFFISLVIPLALIVYYGFQKFENEMLLQYRWKSSDTLVQINKILNARLTKENQRSPIDYHYFQDARENNSQAFLYRSNTSPLTRDMLPHYPEDLHGLVGYFNIADQVRFNSPLLPYNDLADNVAAETTLSNQDIEGRLEKINRLKNILIDNHFLKVQPEKQERVKAYRPKNAQGNTTQVGEFKMSETKDEKLIFYRNAQINEHSSVQGFIVEKAPFLYYMVGAYVRRARFDNNIQVQLIDSRNINFSYFYTYDMSKQGKASISTFTEANTALSSISLFSGDLVAPFQYLSVGFSTDNLPLGPATSFVLLFIVVLSAVIIMGTAGFYWLGLKQIALAEQRMNFVSSVSHELKTPLTSILMYSEMLKLDLIKSKKKQHNYYHFIFDESERLSRLINNVLQLSNFNRNQETLSPEPFAINVLIDTIESKVSTLIAKNNFKLNIVLDDISPQTKVVLDLDAFSQIVINLIDNAVKFYNAAQINDPQRERIDVIFKFDNKAENQLSLSIRDYGPGISNSQLDNIFELFYRCGNEMTRTTSGTGIGLALVHQLVDAQEGNIAATRHAQGVSFDLTLPIQNL